MPRCQTTRFLLRVVVHMLIVLAVVGATATAQAAPPDGKGPDKTSENDGDGSTCKGKKCTTTTTTTTTTAPADTTAPTVIITEPAEGDTVDADLTVVGTASDDIALVGVAVTFDGTTRAVEDPSSWSVGFDTSNLAPGTYTVSVTATDTSHNATTATVSVSVDHASVSTVSDPDNIVITDPEAWGDLTPVQLRALASYGPFTGLLYTDWNSDHTLFVHDGSGHVTRLRLPRDSKSGWNQATVVWPAADTIFVTGGSGPIHLRRFHVTWSGGQPSAATQVDHRIFGDTDSRPGDMIALDDGRIALAWHQQGATGPHGQYVAVHSSGTWHQLPMLDFVRTNSSDQRLVQHPADGSVWLFSNPDAWGRIAAAHLLDSGTGGLTVDWVDAEYLNPVDHGLFGPDPENPTIGAAPDPSTDTIVLTYQSRDRAQFWVNGTVYAKSRLAIARIGDRTGITFDAAPHYVERISPHSVTVHDGTITIASHPIDESTGQWLDLDLRSFDGSAWSAPEALGRVITPLALPHRVELGLYDSDGIRLIRR